ncbi:cation diffusion facilitator family transporter [Priestia flexa]|uniref:cation diffusion facilitator family transporter n=1 Tax=Priestia flexa TaxID=86664 RepID=UPI000C236C0F|nr:cation diffusion facilitator family transporter [Priestia flexa]MEC0665500.1 cation diffusion facilitator family transporter [Priestia flexa]MED3824476.1 cation diffusion facilitator family transporter [Priestia flexa]
MDNEQRFKEAQTAAMVGMVGNIVLAIMKSIVGVMANSRALIADAANSVSDVAGSLVVFIGVKIAKQPPDEDHPYGHGKAESIAAIIVAVLLAIVGIEILTSSFQAFFNRIEPPKIFAVYALVAAIIIKEGLYRYTYRIGKKIKSDAVMINAHDHRVDVFSSFAALVGIGASLIGDEIGIEWLVYADPLAGLIVSVLVLKIAWTLGAEAFHSTLDHVLHEEDIAHLKEIVLGVEGVERIDTLHAREHGYYVIVDLRISVDPFITVKKGHQIGKVVKEKLLEEPNIQGVFVHINPYSES